MIPKTLLLTIVVCLTNLVFSIEKSTIDYSKFLSQHDMLWDRVPDKWQVSPFTGNGNIGFLFYQLESEGKNTIALHPGRHDYYDHRLPHEGQQMLWIHRTRLPLGHFKLESKGEITGIKMRQSLWNAELTGEIHTTKGSYTIHGLTHSTKDIIYFETDATGEESVKITWHPDVAYSPVRKTLEGRKPYDSPYWKAMQDVEYPLPPEPILREEEGIQFCLQKLYQHRGETSTAWEITGDSAGKQLLKTSVHHSFPKHNTIETTKKNLLEARALIENETFFPTHQAWWHAYYPQSFITVNDAEKESFYWIQMYKIASAMRGNGPILDLMGPWYNKTFWPMVWGDLNVQLIYWTHLTANRMDLGKSLVDNIDKYAPNLEKNAPAGWEDCATLGACFPQDMLADYPFPDMLVWLLHNYWLHCEYEGDRARMRDGLFPTLRKAVNSYRNYLKENPIIDADGTIHIKYSWSPEYKPGRGQDINFTIALINWSCQMLLDLNEEFSLNDPLAKEWKNIIDHLVNYQVDENGLRIGKDIPFDKPHRHYSHLLAFYPLGVLSADKEEENKLVKTTLDHWLDVTLEGGKKLATGYTCTGASSMYACLEDGETAYKYLDLFIKHPGVAPTTMYAEVGYNPVIESPLSYATSMHDMLLQSWNGKIRVFPASPEKWKDVAFKDFRTKGAFLVSAKKKEGETQFITAKSLIGTPCIIRGDIPNPMITINGITAKENQVKLLEDGFYKVELNKGDTVTLTKVAYDQTDFTISPVERAKSDHNLFGLSETTTRLPGHENYFPEE